MPEFCFIRALREQRSTADSVDARALAVVADRGSVLFGGVEAPA